MVDDERVLLVKPAVRLGLEFQTESAVDSLPGIDGTLVSGLPGDDASVRVLAGDDASPFSSFPVSWNNDMEVSSHSTSGWVAFAGDWRYSVTAK